MRLPSRIKPRQVVGGLVAVSVAAVVSLLLAGLARPAGQLERLRQLEARAAHLHERSARLEALDFRSYRTCDDPPSQAQAALQQRLVSAASSVGLAFDSLDMRRGAGAELTRTDFSGRLTGPYEQIVGLFERLAREEPDIFLERVELASAPTGVVLLFEGGVLCSTRAS